MCFYHRINVHFPEDRLCITSPKLIIIFFILTLLLLSIQKRFFFLITHPVIQQKNFSKGNIKKEPFLTFSVLSPLDTRPKEIFQKARAREKRYKIFFTVFTSQGWFEVCLLTPFLKRTMVPRKKIVSNTYKVALHPHLPPSPIVYPSSS